ncbi:hypothetical protein AJ79_04103 [Helicocarpus griseus UAMH5409]|uniref:ADP-ribosylation factor n=1 Tax=Helicocarpus griseus UAMH5409 TaxID=1447875 RepID=A0A2B7XVU1_9EURO|nr:hypothetical protein AJ79_04103 [Helicocarpus griseus UAMH5409]
MLGQDNAGKTTLLYRFQLGKRVDTLPTTFQIETIRVASEGVNITFWDLGGGCDRIPRPLFRHFQGPDALFLFLFDPTEIFDPRNGAHRAQYAIYELKYALERVVEAKYFAVILTKRDLTSRDNPQVQHQISLLKEVLDEYRPKLPYPCELYDDLDRFSGAKGAQKDILLTRLARVAKIQDDSEVRTVSMKKQAPLPPPDPHRSKPSRKDLLQKIEDGFENRNSLLDSDTFMKSMVSGTLDIWDHRSHLRAGFLTLTECVLRESVVFEAADLFLERLDKMLKAAPHKFRNTAHLTLTVFWLHQIYHAMLSFRERTGSFPGREKFNDFLLEYPDLMYGRSWDTYYSKDALFSPEAKSGWKLPDLQPLPQFISRRRAAVSQEAAQMKNDKTNTNTQKQSPTENQTSEILKRFAFATLKSMKQINRRRAAVINESLPIIQSHIMRLRAGSLSSSSSSSSSPNSLTTTISPYSETQAYFYIQLLHAAISSLPAKCSLDITTLTFENFRTLFPDLVVTDDAWKQYYSEELWNSIEARRRTLLPDIKPLPNVLQAPSSRGGHGRPSVEEMLLEVRWAVKEVGETDFTSGDKEVSKTHAILIYRIFNGLLDAENCHGDNGDSRDYDDDDDDRRRRTRIASLSAAAWDAVSFLHRQQRANHQHEHCDHQAKVPQKFTAAVFWSRMVLQAFIVETSTSSSAFNSELARLSRSSQGSCHQQEDEKTPRLRLFELFLSTHSELCWEGLWREYYSDEVWWSEDAGGMFVAADRRGLPGYVWDGVEWARAIQGVMKGDEGIEKETGRGKDEDVGDGWEVVNV